MTYSKKQFNQLTPRHRQTLARLKLKRLLKANLCDAIGTPLLVSNVTKFCDKCDTKQYCRRKPAGKKRCEIITAHNGTETAIAR